MQGANLIRKILKSLTKNQKQSILLLQTGTFLEYFDLMIYVHMAVVLNELFFPPTDPKTTALLTAFAFCSTYVFRPLGALIFGYIGDTYGRKPTVIMTTTLMGVCCLLMANLPTYAEIGILAAVSVTILRMVQGMSSMGEIMGAEIYITEITKSPLQYPAVCSISLAAAIGAMVALGVATLATRIGFNWRLAFWFGVIVSIIGIIARTTLRETPIFVDAKRKLRKAISNAYEHGSNNTTELLKSASSAWQEKLNFKTCFSFFSIFCGWPLCFYLAYIYFIPLLKSKCGYSANDLILHNFFLVTFQLIRTLSCTLLSYKIYPLFIAKITGVLFIITICIIPYILNGYFNNYYIFIIQSLILCGIITNPADPIIIKHFPIFKRFTAVTFGYALSQALMYVITSFSLVYLTDWLDHYGIWIISFPVSYFWFKGIYHYEDLEKNSGTYPLKGKWQISFPTKKPFLQTKVH